MTRFLRTLVARSLPLIAILAFVSPAHAQDTAGFHYKGLTFTPIGVVMADGLYRSRNMTADIATTYNAIPFDGTSEAHVSEFRLTARHSRIGMAVTGKENGNAMTGYWESDFLSVGTTSNSNESNSYTLRIRQFWASFTNPSHLTFSAGQMWSLMTMHRTGMLLRDEAGTQTIEAQYAVGYNWARQPGFRLVKTGNLISYGVALEAAQTTFSARNAPLNLLVGQTGGTLLNATANYSADVAPDLIAKIAIDPKGWGHWELKAIGTAMRDRFVDPASTSGGSRSMSTTGYGVGGGGSYPVMANNRDVVDVGLMALYGRGVGRYGTTLLPDATVDTSGALRPIKVAHALLTIETHPTTEFDVYAYAGVEYADRMAFVTGAGKGVGYGSPLNSNAGCMTEDVPTGPFAPASGAPCNADTRNIWQGDLGFWYHFYRGSAGTVQWGMQASHTVRNTWSGLGVQPSGRENMLFSSFRVYLP